MEAVFVPMKVDVYLNYTSPYGVIYDPPRPNPVYLTPLTQPNFAALRTESGLIQHDILDDVTQPQPLVTADPARVTDARSGIYLHWSLPRPYRIGIAASDTFEDLDNEKKKSGYAEVPGQAAHNGTPVFRQVPNRWIVRRMVRSTDGSNPVYLTRTYDNYRITYGNADLVSGDFTTWQIESDRLRQIQDIPPSEDIEVTSSPTIDYDLPLYQQGQTFLGEACMAYPLASNTSGDKSYSTSLTAVHSASPFFADLQSQNASVFSFFDDLAYLRYPDAPASQLAKARISYAIIGYYADPLTCDPLAMPLVSTQTPADRLDACQMQLKTLTGLAQATADGMTKGGVTMKTFCHGSFYNILWNVTPENTVGTPQPSTFPPTATVRYPGDMVQNAFDTSHPLAVGTNVLEALFAWLAIQDSTVPKSISAQLLRLQSFVLDINDNLDAQLEAEDMLATNNFIPTACGTRFNFSSTVIGSGSPTPALVAKNEQQSWRDSLVRQYNHFQQEMFFWWWKFICDDGKSTSTNQSMRSAVAKLRLNMSRNQHLRSGDFPLTTEPGLEGNIEAVAEASFYMQQDPTLLIAGCKNAWPDNANEKVNVRLLEQLKSAEARVASPCPVPTGLDGDVSKAVETFWSECDCLDVKAIGYSLTDHGVAPDFYDNGDRWNDTNDNGWFPLYIEWAIEYYNIPWQFWEFAPYGPEGRIGYRIKDGVDLTAHGLAEDCLVIKGRTHIVPQASGVLETALRQVFSKVNPDILAAEVTIDRDALFDAVRKMDFLSTALSGLTDQLITQMQGTHVTPFHFESSDPNARIPPDILTKASTGLGMTQTDFLNMESATSTTPFANLVAIPSDPSKYSPFKPVTHGQFRFTKFNIVDKFGQMVQGIRITNDKLTHPELGIQTEGYVSHTPLFPCLGETYSLEECSFSPEVKGLANAVLRRPDGFCSFVQLPPSINQPARLNADFVVAADGPTPVWRRAEEHENPCRGYLIVNYANASFQVFTADGQFVREYGVRNGKVATMPFSDNAALMAGLDPLLLQLLNEFSSSEYLLNLFQNISETVEAVQANPTHFAESMLSILGRPLALVTFGISLELEGPPLTNQSTIPVTKPAEPTDSVTGYQFSVKIGDRDNVFDGLYGLFSDASADDPFNMNAFYSYHDPDADRQPQYVPLQPFYIDPLGQDLGTASPGPPTAAELQVGMAGYAKQRNQQYKVFSALVDPFTPVHFYTAILPVKQLSIPPWALQQGIDRIAAFFRMGPVLSPIDVPAFDPSKIVAKDYRLDDPHRPAETGVLSVPAVSVTDWNWLQPYWQAGTSATDPGKTVYNLLDVQNPDSKPRWEQPPYVVTEGYLQMKTPFAAADPVLKPANT